MTGLFHFACCRVAASLLVLTTVALHANPLLPGGEATSRYQAIDAHAFSQPSGNLSLDDEFRFKIGNALFRKNWVSSPASTTTSDGLGPLYNARACQNCHIKDGRGHPPEANWPEDDAVSLFLRVSIPPQTMQQKLQLERFELTSIPEPNYGRQIQDFAVPGIDAEAHLRIDYEPQNERLADGTIVTLRRPTYSLDKLRFGPLHPEAMLSPRVTPAMIGLGLLEQIPENQLLANADPDDLDNNSISGRASRIWSEQQQAVVIGRFGWKAGNATIAQQTAGAFAGDIGISSPLQPDAAGDCTANQIACQAAPHGVDSDSNDPSQQFEISRELFDMVVFYASNLAVPQRRNAGSAEVKAGQLLFQQAGCHSCHQPDFVTGADGADHLARQHIWPYTDLLLHDMGAGLADNRPEGAAGGQEWRTPPLWGIGLIKTVNAHTYFLHDGRARNLTEAILWHGGEAETAKRHFAAMSKSQRASLIAFIESL